MSTLFAVDRCVKHLSSLNATALRKICLCISFSGTHAFYSYPNRRGWGSESKRCNRVGLFFSFYICINIFLPFFWQRHKQNLCASLLLVETARGNEGKLPSQNFAGLLVQQM